MSEKMASLPSHSADLDLASDPQASALEGESYDVERGPIDVMLLLAVAVLIGLGTLAVYTGSSWRAAHRFGDSMIHVRQHLMGVALGVIGLLIANRIDFRWYRNLTRSEEHTSELQSRGHLVCRLLLEQKKKEDLPPNTGQA